MSDLYLIAHKVRGEPAFDVACQMACPICAEEGGPCVECDSLGYWWIIPTSGHRAYPYWNCELTYSPDGYEERLDCCVPSMPPDLPDHYIAKATPKVKLADMLGIGKPNSTLAPPPAPIHRRF